VADNAEKIIALIFAADDLGSWVSAALEDEAKCEEFKKSAARFLAALSELRSLKPTRASDAALTEVKTIKERVRELLAADELRKQKPKLIGWRMADYTYETADLATAQNWSANVSVLPIFEGDPNTMLAARPEVP